MSAARFAIEPGTHAQLEIYDPTGRLVDLLAADAVTTWRPLRGASRKVYFARLRGEGVTETVKFVVVQ